MVCFGSWSSNDGTVTKFKNMSTSGLKSLASGEHYVVAVTTTGEVGVITSVLLSVD